MNIYEAALRQQLADLGVAADRYGYITFEGPGQQVPRRIRTAVAHVHSALGHSSTYADAERRWPTDLECCKAPPMPDMCISPSSTRCSSSVSGQGPNIQ